MWVQAIGPRGRAYATLAGYSPWKLPPEITKPDWEGQEVLRSTAVHSSAQQCTSVHNISAHQCTSVHISAHERTLEYISVLQPAGESCVRPHRLNLSTSRDQWPWLLAVVVSRASSHIGCAWEYVMMAVRHGHDYGREAWPW